MKQFLRECKAVAKNFIKTIIFGLLALIFLALSFLLIYFLIVIASESLPESRTFDFERPANVSVIPYAELKDRFHALDSKIDIPVSDWKERAAIGRETLTYQTRSGEEFTVKPEFRAKPIASYQPIPAGVKIDFWLLSHHDAPFLLLNRPFYYGDIYYHAEEYFDVNWDSSSVMIGDIVVTDHTLIVHPARNWVAFGILALFSILAIIAFLIFLLLSLDKIGNARWWYLDTHRS